MARRKKDETGREDVLELIQSARAGDCEWLDEAIREVGYVNPDWGLRQKDVTEYLNLSRQVLSEWEDGGVVATRIGKHRSKWYPLWAFVMALRERGVRHGGGSGDLTEERTALVREQRRAKARENDVAEGHLIAREEHERVMIEMAAQIRASLQSMVVAATMHLEGEMQAAMRTKLETLIRWHLEQMAEGRVAVSDELMAEIDGVISRHLQAQTA